MSSEPPRQLSDLSIPSSNDSIVGVRPITIRRRVAFGDCDPARIAYTPRFAEYLISAYHWFTAVLLDRVEPLAVETPMRGLTLDFRQMLMAGEFFEMQCLVTDIGSRTFTLEIHGCTVAGETAFIGTLSPIAFDPVSRTATQLPSMLRTRLEAYRLACTGQPLQQR